MAAFSYAEAIFRLNDVFWINADDPRFLRDLDQGCLADALLASSSRPCLIVLDDVPYLDDGRCASLSAALEIVLSRGWEVVATCVPSCDPSESMGVPALRCEIDDLLLDESELDRSKSDDEPALHAADGPAARIPGYAWSTVEERSRFLEAVMSEAVPSELLFVHASVLALGDGCFSEIAGLLGRDAGTVFSILSRTCVHAGIDEAAGTFKTEPFSVDEVVRAVRPHRERATMAVRGMDADEWVSRMADLMVAKGRFERACAFVRELCSAEAREPWLKARQGLLFEEGAVLAAQLLADSIGRCRAETSAEVKAASAWRLAVLGDRTRAAREAEAVVEDGSVDDDVRLNASLLLLETASEGQDAERACRLVKGFARFSGRSEEDALAAAAQACRESAVLWKAGRVSAARFRIDRMRWAALAELAAREGVVQACTVAKGQVEEALFYGGRAFSSFACGVLCAAFDAVSRARKSGTLPKKARKAAEDLASFAESVLVELSACGSATVPTLRLIDKCSVSTSRLLEAGANRSFVDSARKLRADLARQRESWAVEDGVVGGDLRGGVLSAAPSPRPDDRAEGKPPLLRVRLLGGLELEVGGRRVDPHCYRRQKVQTLLALLVLARGREVSIDSLERTLWPDSMPSRARNNFYCVWSLLKRALETAPKECPYLVRLQNSCRIEQSLVSSDVDDFLALSERLRFTKPDCSSLPTLLTRMESLYAGDLLPSEEEHPSILRHRKELKSRMVDTLLSIAECACRASEFAVALQAARMALFHDEAREDAYNVLIKAQASAGQRSGAMSTYFRCRTYLNEELGIDPSPQTAALYQRLLVDEAPTGEQLTLPL